MPRACGNRPKAGWHDAGDIVTIDPQGFVTTRDRAKRSAKIGGEMVSLPAVESYAAAVWTDAEHAVVTRRDVRKGEQLVHRHDIVGEPAMRGSVKQDKPIDPLAKPAGFDAGNWSRSAGLSS